MKTCSKCREVKDLTCFGTDSSQKDSKNRICKDCCNLKGKRQYASDPLIKNKKCETAKEWRKNNPEKSREISRKWNKANPEQRRDTQLKYLYGLSLDKYNEMVSKQYGCCAICVRPQSKLRKPLCVDHNHVTGAVRGLLCHTCNRVLGMLQDDPKLALNVAKYLS
jgi:hypothetical protein